MRESPQGILLAAGQSTRFGANKLIQPLHDGIPIIVAAAKMLCAALPNCLAVVNNESLILAKHLAPLGMEIIINYHAARGIGNSIACGVKASETAPGWIITLADMPYVRTDTIAQVARQLNAGAGIVAPVYQQRRGHPVGFAHHYRAELLQLDNDIGAREIIAKHPAEITLFETDDDGVITDIDRVEDLKDSEPSAL